MTQATHDPLRDLLGAAPAAKTPEPDLAFTFEVMAKVERRRFQESLVWWVGGALAACLLLAIIMPYLTPVIADLGKSLWPAAVAVSLIGVFLAGFEQVRRFIRL